jgi:hypothetical protein
VAKLSISDTGTVAEESGSSRSVQARILAGVILGNDPQKERELLREIPTLARFVQETYLPFAKSAKRSWRTDETVLRIHIAAAFRSCST